MCHLNANLNVPFCDIHSNNILQMDSNQAGVHLEKSNLQIIYGISDIHIYTLNILTVNL